MALGSTGRARVGSGGPGVRGNAGVRRRFKGSRRDEVLGVGPSRLLRMDPGTGSVTRAWRYSALRQWNVNWDTQQVLGALGGTAAGPGGDWERTGKGLRGTAGDWE